MATKTLEAFRCMMCGHEYEEQVATGEDKERSCPRCRSNSIRHLKRRAAAQPPPALNNDPQPKLADHD